MRVLVERNATICRFLNEEALGERAVEGIERVLARVYASTRVQEQTKNKGTHSGVVVVIFAEHLLNTFCDLGPVI